MKRILAITGGIGGAKLGLGLAAVLEPEALSFIVNTGDDFEHLGFAISPDLDTLIYTLAGEVNQDTGWGRRDETWNFMDAISSLGGETWFNLGDRDLALHVRRTEKLRYGARLTEVVGEIARHLGVQHALLPMTDDPVRTVVETPQGDLMFQHYFVRDRCQPPVTGFRFEGAENARLTPEIESELAHPDLAGVVICPSNPFVSVDPVLAVPGMREGLQNTDCPVIAVSPIVAGAALKGPTAKMMRELGIPNDAIEVARHYRGLIDGFVLDSTDTLARSTVADLIGSAAVTNTVMLTLEDRVQLAHDVLVYMEQLDDSNS